MAIASRPSWWHKMAPTRNGDLPTGARQIFPFLRSDKRAETDNLQARPLPILNRAVLLRMVASRCCDDPCNFESRQAIRTVELQTTGRRSHRTEFECGRQRKQHAHVASRVVGRAIAQRESDAIVGLQVVGQKEAYAAAGRGQRNTVGEAVAVVPGRAGVDEAVELIAGQIPEIQLLVETQFERTGDAVVAADLGAP